MNLRERVCTGVMKIGVVEMYSNGLENAIKPFQMNPHPTNPSFTNHADNVIKVIRYYVPNAEIHLVPSTAQGLQYLIAQGIKLVNVSLSGYSTTAFRNLAESAFLVIAAGNDGDEGESGLARMDKVCAVGAVNSSLQPMSYSSYGHGVVKTTAIAGLTKYTGQALHGTSFAAPVVTGLLAQWYIWFHQTFNIYPSIKHANRFVIQNSDDIFEDSWDMRTGHGLMRLPKEFTHRVFEVTQNVATGTVITYSDVNPPVSKTVTLLATPAIQNGRFMVAVTDLGDVLDLSITYDAPRQTGVFIQ
jgi:alkylated DNA nucleotide flippase Atl1